MDQMRLSDFNYMEFPGNLYTLTGGSPMEKKVCGEEAYRPEAR